MNDGFGIRKIDAHDGRYSAAICIACIDDGYKHLRVENILDEHDKNNVGSAQRYRRLISRRSKHRTNAPNRNRRHVCVVYTNHFLDSNRCMYHWPPYAPHNCRNDLTQQSRWIRLGWVACNSCTSLGVLRPFMMFFLPSPRPLLQKKNYFISLAENLLCFLRVKLKSVFDAQIVSFVVSP